MSKQSSIESHSDTRVPLAYVVVRSTYVCELSLEVTQFTNLPDAYRAFIAATLKVSKINDGGEDLLSCLSDEHKCENCGDMEPCLPSCLAAKKIVALKSGDNESWKFFNFGCGRGDDVVRVRNGCLSLSSAADDGVRGESRLIPIYSSDQSSIDKARVKRSRPEEMAERVQERIDDRDSFNFCPNCGKQFKGGNNFCGGCGVKRGNLDEKEKKVYDQDDADIEAELQQELADLKKEAKEYAKQMRHADMTLTKTECDSNEWVGRSSWF